MKQNQVKQKNPAMDDTQLQKHHIFFPAMDDTLASQCVGQDRMYSGSNFQQGMSSQSLILPEVIKQKFFTFSLSDFWGIDDHEATGLLDDFTMVSSYNSVQNIYEGRYVKGGSSAIPLVDISFAREKKPLAVWALGMQLNQLEEEFFRSLSNNMPFYLDIGYEKMETLKKMWDLTVQFYGLFGDPVIPGLTGLLNNPDVTVNTSVLSAGKLSTLTGDDFETAVISLFTQATQNSNFTQMPNRIIVSSTENINLNKHYDSHAKTRKDFILDAGHSFAEDFQIMFLPFMDKIYNAPFGLKKDRIMVYRYKGSEERDTFQWIAKSPSFSLPVPTGAFTSEIGVYGSLSGCNMKYPSTAMYFDAP